jgi:predicted transcriptional regulator
VTQEKLARVLRVTQPYISKLRAGKLRPSRLRAEVWEPITGWTWKQWQKATVKQIQKLLDGIKTDQPARNVS